MQIIRKRAFARAGLLGNPSDGYHGKTVSFLIRDFWSAVTLYEWEDLELVPSQEDNSRFRSVQDLVRDVELHGYYGGVRLVKATAKKFVEYCQTHGHYLHERNFSVRYESNIPRQVGMAGSSAIIVATLRCLMEFYDIAIPLPIQPSLVLAVEIEELGIAGGLQDRVVQVYEGLVYMDFAEARMQKDHDLEYGVYEPLDLNLLPPIYIAYSTAVAEPGERQLEPLRTRYDAGEPLVHSAMKTFADVAERGRRAILDGDAAQLAELIDKNFDTRRSISPHMSLRQIEMVELARGVGASAKFAGSGGAIVGTFRDATMFRALEAELGKIDCHVFEPTIDRA